MSQNEAQNSSTLYKNDILEKHMTEIDDGSNHYKGKLFIWFLQEKIKYITNELVG